MAIRIKDLISEENSSHSKYWHSQNNSNNTTKEGINKTVRMRTIAEAIKVIKEVDPDTAFTQTALRRMIISGEIPSIKIGNKYLVNLDTLCDYLNNPPSKSEKTFTQNGIRPINEKIYK